jgi:hypothetical protein
MLQTKEENKNIKNKNPNFPREMHDDFIPFL